MNNQINNNEISKWAIRLKGNWKKGVHVLDYIMQLPLTASEFIEDGNGLLCVYGVLDRNSLELANVIEKHGYGDRALTRYLNITLGWEQPNFAAILASETAISTIVASTPAMTAVAASSTAMAAVATSSTAMAAVAASTIAMKAIAASNTACQAIEASSTAKAVLFNSPLAQTISGIAATSTWTNRRSGNVWLIWHKQTWGTGSGTLQVRYTVAGNQTVFHTNDQTYNKDCRVDRFMRCIENYASVGGIGNAVSYRFIPC